MYSHAVLGYAAEREPVKVVEHLPGGGISLARSAQAITTASLRGRATSREKEKLLQRARRISGQADALERAILSDRSCVDLVNLIVATRGALNALMSEVVREHVVDHVLEPAQRVSGPRGRAAAELLSILKSYVH